MNNFFKAYIKSELGIIEIAGTFEGIYSIDFVDSGEITADVAEPLKECVKQLGEYFKGERRSFELKLIPEGTEFQKKVWKKLLEVPFGKTASYADIAEAVGNKKSVRAVGNANGKNKIAIVIPCHRIIGSNGSLTGYAGELWRKQWLLNHEAGFADGGGFK